MIKNVIFDLGGVLVDWDPEGALRRMGLPEEEAQEIAQHTTFSPEWNEVDRSAIAKEQLFARMIANVPEKYRKDAARFLNAGVFDGIHSFSSRRTGLKA